MKVILQLLNLIEIIYIININSIMVAVGITSDGKRIEFDCSDGILFCYYNDLVSLEVFDGVKRVYCHNNKLTELIIPKGVKEVYCWNNLLKELIIPDSVELILCDKKVSGLDELIGKVDIELW